MAGRVSWRPRATEDLAEAYVYIGADSPSAAERLLEAVDDEIRFLLKQPGAGRPWSFRSRIAQGIRSWRVRGFESYLIFYRADAKGMDVIRIIHGARDIPRLLEPDV